MQFNPFFDATSIPPEQGGARHPVGSKFPAVIANTAIQVTKAGDGGMFVVTLQTPAGEIDVRYGLWNKSEQTVEISQKQLSALLWAIGIFKIHMTKPDGSPDMENAGSEIRNARCQIDVRYQKGHEPSAEKPTGGWTEVGRVYDANGNEPGKTPSVQTSPLQQAPSSFPAASVGGWNAPAAATQQPAQQAPQQGWPQPAPAQNNAPAVSPGQPANAGGWQPGPSASAPGGAPPWMQGK